MTSAERSDWLHSLPLRLWHMASGWGFVGLVYSLARRLQGPAQAVIPETALDRLIAFDPFGVWVYLSFFVLIPCAYLFCNARRLSWLSRSMQLCGLVCGALYLLWPTTLVYPPVQGASVSAEMLRQLIGVDSTQNCLPSLHGALSLLAIWALSPARATPLRGLLLCAWGAAIAFAVVQTRRHLVLDFSAGLLAGWLCGLAVRAMQRAPAAAASSLAAINARSPLL